MYQHDTPIGSSTHPWPSGYFEQRLKIPDKAGELTRVYAFDPKPSALHNFLSNFGGVWPLLDFDHARARTRLGGCLQNDPSEIASARLRPDQGNPSRGLEERGQLVR
jgi:hypothetical protein